MYVTLESSATYLQSNIGLQPACFVNHVIRCVHCTVHAYNTLCACANFNIDRDRGGTLLTCYGVLEEVILVYGKRSIYPGHMYKQKVEARIM